ncbi:MAG: CPBP family glutamic-type intramembrane protease [Mariniblastus sp.]|nr:CPBP family glutamic-type intramembrane protease [Mariniblastus sp.]
MNWSTIKLIFRRELRDQLRDRRTLFTVAIMPMLLYPLMGMAMMQVAQFMRESPSRVWIVGEEKLPASPPLIVGGKFNPTFGSAESKLIELIGSEAGNGHFEALIQSATSSPGDSSSVEEILRQEMQKRKMDLAIFIPNKIQIPEGPDALEETVTGSSISPPATQVFVLADSAIDKSRIASERVNQILNQWSKEFSKETLVANDISASMIRGIVFTTGDVANKTGKQAAAWSKILPFIIMIWALTGAFYPAIDLCAGEKERGTFETLLSSPAARSEIALGKLLTVMTFSMATSFLNLLSMGVTGIFVLTKLGNGMGAGNALPIGIPPLTSIGWLLLALIPISALFSAVALAAAAFARSSKEGQYYLVPLLMISMPLMMIPMLPTAELDFGTSLIPVSGLMLLLRGLIEANYSDCLKFAAPVCAINLGCCWLAVRWVIHQFNSETVLFQASERFGIGAWLKHIMRERRSLPSLGSAILCGVVILVAKFFVGFAVTAPQNFSQFAFQTVIILVATIFIPSVMMALFLTRNPRKSLRLNGCKITMAAAAVLCAIFLNPAFTWLTGFIMHIYPPNGDILMLQEAVSKILGSAPGLWAILLVFALAPAVFEEIAFRGFILSGFQSLKGKWQPILLTSLMFGLAHGIIQQTIITFVVGMILGLIAVQTKSILPCILFHLTHNSLAVLLSQANRTVVEQSPVLRQYLYSTDGQNYQYATFPAILMSVVGVMLIVWFLQLDMKPSNRSAAYGSVPKLS